MDRRYRESWTDADVQCPFYICDDRHLRTVTCEGFGDDFSNILRFRDNTGRNRHMGRYCVSGYTMCPVFRAANEKYE